MDPDSNDDRQDHQDLSTISLAMPSMSPDGAALSVLSGSAKGRVVRLPGKLDAMITLGKAPGNDLVIDDPTVSRRHLSIRRTEAGLELCDLDSTNGVFIGTTRIRSALVEPGTMLRAGDVELLVGVELARRRGCRRRGGDHVAPRIAWAQGFLTPRIAAIPA